MDADAPPAWAERFPFLIAAGGGSAVMGTPTQPPSRRPSTKKQHEIDEGSVAHLEPWWSSTSPVNEPYHDDTPYPGSPAGHPSHILLGPVYDSGLLDIPPDEYPTLGYLDYQELLDELGLSRWRPILEAFCSDCHEATTPSHAADSELSYSDHSGVRIGPPSVTHDTAQASITQTVADD